MTLYNYKEAVLITGGTGGIGSHCAQHIAAQRPDLLVIVASRVRFPPFTSFLCSAGIGELDIWYSRIAQDKLRS